jgi:hypothetical protein
MLKAAAEQPGSHLVHSMYALALIDAEGGHYQEVGAGHSCAGGLTWMWWLRVGCGCFGAVVGV